MTHAWAAKNLFEHNKHENTVNIFLRPRSPIINRASWYDMQHNGMEYSWNFPPPKRRIAPEPKTKPTTYVSWIILQSFELMRGDSHRSAISPPFPTLAPRTSWRSCAKSNTRNPWIKNRKWRNETKRNEKPVSPRHRVSMSIHGERGGQSPPTCHPPKFYFPSQPTCHGW